LYKHCLEQCNHHTNQEGFAYILVSFLPFDLSYTKYIK
jgi:hypothetical protein